MRRLKREVCVFGTMAILICAIILGGVKVYAQNMGNKEILFENDRVMDGIYEEETLYFQMEDYWEVESAELQIHMELSSMLLDIPAELNFQLNGTPIQSVNLNYANGVKQDLSIALPAEHFKEGYNSLTVTGFAQIYDEEGCLDEFSEANWIVIGGESGVYLSYRLKEMSGTVAEYPYPLIYGANENGEGIKVVVPDNADSDELTAAAWIQAGLVKEVPSSQKVQMVYNSEYENGTSSGIIVSLYEHISERVRNAIQSNGIEEAVLENNAAIIIDRAEEGRVQVFIVSKKGTCLSEAAQLLMDKSRRTQEEQAAVLVAEGSADLLKEGIEDTSQFTLSDWIDSDSGIELRGSFRREYTIYPPQGIAYVLGTDDNMHLKFRYSENLNFTRSLFTVYVNGAAVASKKLKKENAQGDEMELIIPEDLSGKALESITLAFDLEVEELYCTVRLDETPWAFISGDSSISLSGSQNNYLSFQHTPWPFVKNGYGNHLMFLIPDAPSGAELTMLGTLVGMYGRGMNPYGELEIVHAGEVQEKQTQDAQIILLGSFENQGLLELVKENLPFSINMEDRKFIGNKSFAFSDSYASAAASMQLIPSIYNKDKAMLVVTAPDDTALGYLNEYLSVLDNLDKLKGDTMLVDSHLEMRSFTFQHVIKDNDRPTLRQRLEQNKESVLFSLAATSVMFLLFLAAILIFIRVRAINKKGQ